MSEINKNSAYAQPELPFIEADPGFYQPELPFRPVIDDPAAIKDILPAFFEELQQREDTRLSELHKVVNTARNEYSQLLFAVQRGEGVDPEDLTRAQQRLRDAARQQRIDNRSRYQQTDRPNH